MSYSNPNEAYDQLKNNIIARQHIEETHSYQPYTSFPTTIDYSDLRDFSLLHYAAASGNINKIEECLSAGANINNKSHYNKLTPIGMALKYGQTQAADELYQQNAKCLKLEAEVCHKESKAWFFEKIKKALYQAYPVPSKNFTEAKADNQFFRQSKPLSLSVFKSAKKTEDFIDPLIRAAEIGELDFIIAAKANDEKKVNAQLNSLLVKAAANGQMNVIEWALKNGAAINNNLKFSPSALNSAIQNNYPEVIEYLLKHGADINKLTNLKFTPIMIAVIYHPELIESLLPYNPDLTLTDVDDNNILHHMAENPRVSMSMQNLLLTNPKAFALLYKKNIYGFTPIDIAIQNKNDTFLKLTVPYQLDDIKKSNAYGNLPIRINQSTVRQKMFHYLKSQYRDISILDKGGSCNAFTYLYHIYAALGLQEYFFSTLELMANWDGKENTLFEPFHDIPQAQYYRNLAELFEQWINDIVLFQFSLSLMKVIQLDQSNRQAQYSIIGDRQELNPVYLFDTMEQHEQRTSITDFNKMLNYLLRMPKKTHLELSGDGHITGAYINDEKKIDYYDPNFAYRTTKPNDSNEMIRRVMNYKYIFTGIIGDEVGESSKIIPEFRSFIFQKDMLDFKESNKIFKVFAEDELPKSNEEAEEFQNNTPNRYSPLHIAVLTTSLASLLQLLDNEHCDLNAKDAYGMTALDLALRFQTVGSLALLLINHPKITIDNPPVIPYLKGSKAFASMLVENTRSSNLENLLYAAIFYDDLELIEKLIVKNKIDINKKHDRYHSPLMAAINHKNEDIVKLFLKYDADILNAVEKPQSEIQISSPNTSTCVFVTPLSYVIEHNSPLYPLLIQQLKDINAFDKNGRSALHWAVITGQSEILQDLLQRGADIKLQTQNGQDCFDLLNELRDNNQDKYLDCQRVLLSHYQFDVSARPG